MLELFGRWTGGKCYFLVALGIEHRLSERIDAALVCRNHVFDVYKSRRAAGALQDLEGLQNRVPNVLERVFALHAG